MSTKTIFAVTINAQAPLQLGNQSGFGNFGETGLFIPGAALRGAAAARLIAEKGVESEPFRALFETDDLFFGNAYPGQSGPVYPPPLTARTCKYYPGIPSSRDKPWKVRHGMFDLAIPRVLYELLVDPAFPQRDTWLPKLGGALPNLPRAWGEVCPKCKQDMQPATKYYIPAGKQLIRAEPAFVRRRAHVGINRARHVAEDGLLFTQEVIEPPSKFYGQVVTPEGKAGLLTQALTGEHFLGRGRSRGQGRVKIGVDPFTTSFELAERVALFNRQVHQIWQSWVRFDARLPKKLPGIFFSLTLRSPAIFEKYGQPALIPDLHEPLPEAALVRSWSRAEQVGGWDTAAKLPRRTRLGAQAGSVYLYHWPAGDLPLDFLTTLEQDGIGAERSRGFGQVHICAPIHSHHILP